MSDKTVIVAGHICLDIIPNLNSIPEGQFAAHFQPGHLIEAGPTVIATGGPVSNTGLALHILGIPTRLMGKIGDDLFGQAVLNIVRSYGAGLAEGMVIDKTSSTSYTVIISSPGVDRMFLHSPGANNTFCAGDVDFDQVAQAALLHFGYPPVMRRLFENGGAELAELYRRAKATGATTSLDMTFPDPASPGGRADWPSIYRSTLPNVDIFLPSVEELLFTLRRETYNRLEQSAGSNQIQPGVTPELLSHLSCELLSMGVKIAVIKIGDRGVYLRTASHAALQAMGRARPSDLFAWADIELWAPCFQVNVVGTTGAGDATIAGFLSGLLRGMLPMEAVTAALAVGACNVEAADALSGICPWEVTLRRIQAGWPRHPLLLSSPGWQWDPEANLWVGPGSQ